MKEAVLILAGGKSTRMGSDKALLPIENTSFLNFLCGKWTDYDTYISDNKDRKHDIHGMDVIVDEYEDMGPMNGIVSCFHQRDMDSLFVIACDMPYMNIDVMEYLYTYLDGYDGVFVKEKDRIYPLGGIYTRKMLPILEQQIEGHRYSLQACIAQCHVCILDIETLPIDKKVFMNINTREEYDTLFK